MEEPLKYPAVRLEYYQEDCEFSFESCETDNENTWGYVTIHPEIDADVADDFANLVDEKYRKTATVQEVRQEMVSFLAEKGRIDLIVSLSLYENRPNG